MFIPLHLKGGLLNLFWPEYLNRFYTHLSFSKVSLKKPEAFVVEAGNLWFNVMVGKLFSFDSPTFQKKVRCAVWFQHGRSRRSFCATQIPGWTWTCEPTISPDNQMQRNEDVDSSWVCGLAKGATHNSRRTLDWRLWFKTIRRGFAYTCLRICVSTHVSFCIY